MPKNSQYSSFKKQQILAENFRNFLEGNEEDEAPLEEALTGGIDEFAKELGVPGLPHGFTDDQLVDFVNNILAASPAQEAGSDFSKIAPRTQGETNKSFQGRSDYARADHPLTTPTIAGQPKSGVGFALEKLIMNRVATAKLSGRSADALEQARLELINTVSPTGAVAAKKGIGKTRMASKHTNRPYQHHAMRKKAVQGPGGAALGLQEGIIKMKVLNLKKEKKSVLKNIIEEEVRKLKLKEADMSSDEFYDFMSDPRHRPRNKPRYNPQPAKPKRPSDSDFGHGAEIQRRIAAKKAASETGGEAIQAAELVKIMRDPKLHAAIARVTAREKLAIKALLDMITAMTGQGEQAGQQVGLLMQKLGAAIEKSGSGK